MFERVIDWSIEYRFLVVVAAILVAAVGAYSLMRAPLDAIPDLSDVQVIVYTEYPGQAPRIVEDQVTYPLTTQLLAVPRARVVRGYSFFGYSFVYVIFDDGTDLYWARARTLETLSHAAGELPPGVTPSLGPDATGVGWAFMYALTSDRHDLGELRSIQDWFLKYELASVPGVSEVASIGGFVKQYQITVDPNRLRAYDISIAKIRAAVEASNSDVGGRSLEFAEKEFMIRGIGTIGSVDDIRKISLGVDANGAPILLKDVARVGIGPEMRRGIAEWNGEGETVGGIVVVRHGAGTLRVIKDVKAKLEAVKAGLPEGVEVHVGYDRTALIERSVASLRTSLVQQLLIVGLVSMVFLLHFRSGLVAVVSLPVGILAAFLVMSLQGINVNIMSLGGIAVAIGTMVDASIVMVENAHRHLAMRAEAAVPGVGARREPPGRRGPGPGRRSREASGGAGPRRPRAGSLGGHRASRQGGRTHPVLRPAGDHRVVPAGVRPRSPGGSAVQAAGLRQDLRHGCRGAARGDAGAGAGRVLGAGTDLGGGPEPDQPRGRGVRPGRIRLLLAGAPGAERGVSVQVRRPRAGGAVACRDRHPPVPHRLRIHADPVGGRPALHAHHVARHLGDQGRRTAAADRPDNPHLSGGGERLRQGRPCRDCHRPGTAVDDRDDHHAEAQERVAARHDARKARRRDECRHRRAPDSPTPGRCPSGPASTCSPPASRRRSESRSRAPILRNSNASARRSKPWCATFRGRSTRTPSGSWVAAISTSRSTATPSAATGSRSATYRTSFRPPSAA